MSRIKFLNTEIDNLTMNEALDVIKSLIIQNKNSYVVTPNVDHIVQLEKDKELAMVYKNADLILTDGTPLIWMSKWMKTPIKEKISGSDLFPKLCELSAKQGYKMFFLGAAPGVAARAAQNLQLRFQNLQVIGTYSPPYKFEQNSSELHKIEEMIKNLKPDILVVGLGCPKQEKFIFHNKERLGVPLSLGLGASFDFEAGRIKRAPKWMSNIGLEWLYRIMQDPKRLWKRYLVDDMKIIKIYFKYRRRKTE